MKFLTQKSTAFLLLALSAATGLLLLTFSHNLMYYWLFGFGFGIILQRSHICFVSAASDPILSQSTDQFRSILIAILIASFGISAIKYLSGGMFDTLGVAAVSIPLILGAFIFGIGMELAGCCCSGMFIRMGEGYSVHFITFIFVVLGYTLGNTHYDQLWAPLIQQSPSIFFPERFGWGLGVGIHIAILMTFYIIAVKRDTQPAANENTAYLKGAICLGILSVIHIILLKSQWSVSGAFYWIEGCTKNLFTGTIKDFLNCKASIEVAAGSNLRNLGLLVGSLISVLFSSQFNFRKIHSRQQVIKSVIGGSLMGYGACIAGGCNIAAFFMATASLSLSGWIFMIALFGGAFVGIKLLYKFV